MSIEVPAQVTREEIETAFPWVCYLPDGAMGEFMAAIELWRSGAEVYSGERQPSLLDQLVWSAEPAA